MDVPFLVSDGGFRRDVAPEGPERHQRPAHPYSPARRRPPNDTGGRPLTEMMGAPSSPKARPRRGPPGNKTLSLSSAAQQLSVHETGQLHFTRMSLAGNVAVTVVPDAGLLAPLSVPTPPATASEPPTSPVLRR